MRRLKPFYPLAPAAWPLPPLDETGPAESVRQWIVAELIASYGFPESWLGTRIKLARPGGIAGSPGDLLGLTVLTAEGDVYLSIVVGPSGQGEAAERGLREWLRHSPTARVGLCSDGTPGQTKALRCRSDSGDSEYLIDIEGYDQSISMGQPYVSSRDAASGEAGNGPCLQRLSRSVENLFFDAHSHIRDIDGLHADESLDELCKFLYAKLHDEEVTPIGAPYRIQAGLYGSIEEFAASIRRLYRDANEYDLRVFSLKVPGYDRSRGVFDASIRLSSPALVKVAETLQDYNLSASGCDIKGRAFQKVLWPGARAGMGQYFTPHPVIDFMVGIVEPSIQELILDPFAGSGHFLTRTLDRVRKKGEEKSRKQLTEFAFHKLHGIEKSDRMVRIAMTDMRLHGDGQANVRCTDSLMDFANYPDIQPESFDVILTNPPFGSLLGPDAIARLGRFDLAQGRKTVPLEVLGLERCIQFLRPGGRLGIVLPDGILANRGTHYLRTWLEQHARIRAIVSLPIETFSPFGANIKTSLLFARKWKKGEEGSSDQDVQLVKVDNIGHDATGRPREGNELDEASAIVRDFMEREGW